METCIIKETYAFVEVKSEWCEDCKDVHNMFRLVRFSGVFIFDTIIENGKMKKELGKHCAFGLN